MAAIELSGLTKRFDDVTALDGIDMTVHEGEIFGFLGPNGAGKSTTINILLDFVRPTSGEARVLGMDAQNESEAIRSRVGVLPDGYHVYDRLTGRQHVEFVAESKGADDAPAEILARVGIPDAADRKAGGYSKGMKQRLVLGMALVGDPDLLILDEPTTGLDPNGAREMRELIEAERDRGKTIFFSSHILDQVDAVCDRVAILQNGDIVATDTVEGLRDARGGDATLRVTVDTIDEDALDRIRAMADVSSLSVTDSTLTVTVADGAKTRVLATLEDAGVEIRDFETEESSLEDIFVSYTQEGSA